jgi:DNA-binding NarL/FixJ family response regulator
MVTVAVVDDERLVLSGFELILDSDPGIEVVGACNGPDALELIARRTPDVVLLDIHMPHVSGLDVLEQLRALPANVHPPRVIMLTTFAADESTLTALSLGAAGFLLKDIAPADLISCVHQVAAGRTVFSETAAGLLRTGLTPRPPDGQERLAQLSARERDVLALLGAGHSNSQIARRLGLSASTVKDHVSRILDKTRSGNRTQAAVLAAQAGLDHEG